MLLNLVQKVSKLVWTDYIPENTKILLVNFNSLHLVFSHSELLEKDESNLGKGKGLIVGKGIISCTTHDPSVIVEIISTGIKS